MNYPGLFKIQTIFLVLLFITMIVSLYIFIQAILCDKNNYKCIYSTWQFPMLLALFLESLMLEYKG